MKRAVPLTLWFCGLAMAAEPVRTAWIMRPAANASLARVTPEVHLVEVGEQYAVVRSAGVSLRYLGPLQPRPVPNEAVREFEFMIPLHPLAETGRHARVPMDVIGAFVNGLPIYNQFAALSYQAANLWHYDAVANNDDGTLTAAGHPRAGLTHAAAPGLLEQLIENGAGHSPLIGFALDGYPVYGPWAYANADGSGGLRRMRSSYRLRSIARRHDWPDGTQLTPEQYGPDVSAAEPLGTFTEDYEYASGSGDLDEFNGRFAITPQYPHGTYAYFLTTDAAGRLAFPYLIGPRFFGCMPTSAGGKFFPVAKKHLTLSASDVRINAGHAVRFRLEAPGRFEYVHERPIHLLVASADLAEFDHIHPELTADDTYEVAYTFQHGGTYRMWADFSLAGEAPRVEEFDIDVSGAARPPQKLAASPTLTQSAGSLAVNLVPSKPLRAGDDIPITLKLTGPTESLEPYLGAWAHVIVVSEDLRSFSHAHPIEVATMMSAAHTHIDAGPAPGEIHILTNFPSAGLYKLWAQFQQAGKVVTVPFVIRVGPATGAAMNAVNRIPADALRIRVTQHGYEPAKFEIPANTPLSLAFTREPAPNCGSEVVFPTLGIRKALPLGQTVLVQLPAQPGGEISFSCGMGMYRGMIVAR